MGSSTGIPLAIVTLSLLINLRLTISSSSATMVAVSKDQPSCQSMCSECDNPCQPLPVPSPPPPVPRSPPPPQSLPPPAIQNCPPPPTLTTYVYPSPPPPAGGGGSNCPGECNPILPYFPFYYQSPPVAPNLAAELRVMRFFGFPAVGTILLSCLYLL
ncbi:hypothetical protein LINGRAHAP2_LOCUS15965 [Linum grandiflorum]